MVSWCAIFVWRSSPNFSRDGASDDTFKSFSKAIRIISPNRSIELNEFIKKYVNIYQSNYDYALVSTAISIFALEAYQIYLNPRSNFLQRLNLATKRKKYEKTVKKSIQTVDTGDFEFELVPLPNADNKETITSVAQTLFTVIGSLIQRPISDTFFVLRGIPNLPEQGNYYTGKPHIHIIRHSDQLNDSLSNENKHKESFGRILARIPGGSGNFSKFVPSNSRQSDDFSAYITSAATLWVWSKKGLESDKQWIDINRGNFIYERQVQVELLEYGFMIHKSLAEKSGELKNYLDIIETRRDLVELKSKMLETTPYGEVRDLLNKGWEEMNLAALQSQISDNLSIMESELKFLESKQGDIFRVFLTVFGLIVSASFSKSIVSPLWKVLGFWLPSNENWSELFLIFISATLVIPFILLLRQSIYRQ
ncbi:MAG: hypothetical protein AAGA60_18325 [Cyanobacteria bacterium P01_E01_bin.42]